MTLRGTNWGRKERLSPQLWPYLGLSRRGLPGLTCHQAIADKFPHLAARQDGEAKSQIPNMLADVSHLVGAPQWSGGGRPCGCRISITEPCGYELAFQSLPKSLEAFLSVPIQFPVLFCFFMRERTMVN